MLGNFVCFLVIFEFFLKINFFKKNLSGIPLECQTVWIQIRLDVLMGLIWIKTVCKGYLQMTKVATSGERVSKTTYLVIWLKFPIGLQLTRANSIGSRETAQM